MTGEVVKVEDGNIYLSLGARDHVLPGLQLTLLRSRETAPANDAAPGVNRLEEAIGYVIVEQVFERYALAQLLALTGAEAQRGDKVRIISGPVVLGVLPVANTTAQPLPHGRWTTALQLALEANGRFRVVSANRILLCPLSTIPPWKTACRQISCVRWRNPCASPTRWWRWSKTLAVSRFSMLPSCPPNCSASSLRVPPSCRRREPLSRFSLTARIRCRSTRTTRRLAGHPVGHG